MTQIINVGLIGAGKMGRLHAGHLKQYTPQADLVAIADISKEAAQKLGCDLDVSSIYEDYHHLLENENVEAVLCCTSPHITPQIIRAAAAAGKHVFCEKPIGLDLVQISQAVAAANQAAVKLQVGFHRRFDPNFRRVREVITSGQIGTPHILRLTSRDPQPPPITRAFFEAFGGLFLDMLIHDLDMARFLIDSEVEEIYSAGGVMIFQEMKRVGDIDTAITMIRFKNGVIATIDNSRQAVYGYDQRVEIFGAGGAVITANVTPDSAIISDAQGVHSALPLADFLERYDQAYINEIQAFIDCIRQDTPSLVDGRDGLLSVVMAYAAKKSYEENRPVKLAEIETSSA
jgi:myo-inositol 2-dehydrogenase/D-chiro-inositol 1-dehydrogenase